MYIQKQHKNWDKNVNSQSGGNKYSYISTISTSKTGSGDATMLVTHADGNADSVVFNTVMSPNSPYTDGTVSLSYGSPWRLEILKSGCSINGTAVESGHVETWLYTTIKNFMITCKSSGGGGQTNDITGWTFVNETTTTTIANWQSTPTQTTVTIDPDYRYIITESIMSDPGNTYTTNSSGDIINMTNHTQNSPITITRSGNTYTLYQPYAAYTTWTIRKFAP